MAAPVLYEQVYDLLERFLDAKVCAYSRERIALLVLGLLHGKSVAPAHIARALFTLGLCNASVESLERRIRRSENDAQLDIALCLHPLAQHYLAVGTPNPLLLIIDPTTKQDEVTLLAITIPYRGRSLPIAWMAWPGNQPLEGERFWERVKALLEQVAPLLPRQVPVLVLGDRAFGTPAFFDLVRALGWHYIVRVQDQTRYKDRSGREQTIRSLVCYAGQRAKGRYQVFKKAGWRSCSVLVLFSRHQKRPLCLVSDLRPRWDTAHLYARRYNIEAGFRDYKAHGWHWEASQVQEIEHWKRLLVIMALATWIALMAGTQMARHILGETHGHCRLTRAAPGKYSLLQLGLDLLDRLLVALHNVPLDWQLSDWNAPIWSQQIMAAHVRAFLFSDCQRKSRRPQ
jgi:hypothetical protein